MRNPLPFVTSAGQTLFWSNNTSRDVKDQHSFHIAGSLPCLQNPAQVTCHGTQSEAALPALQLLHCDFSFSYVKHLAVSFAAVCMSCSAHILNA